MTDSACALFAVGLPENATAFGMVTFSATGILVVLLSLSLLVAFCVAIGYVLRAVAPRLSRNSTADDVELSDEMVAVIAAVAEVISAPHRIVHIRGLTPEDLGWTLEGRMQHHLSHKNPHPHR